MVEKFASTYIKGFNTDRDSAWWNNNSEDVQRRRDIFWELFAFERLQASVLYQISPFFLRTCVGNTFSLVSDLGSATLIVASTH